MYCINTNVLILFFSMYYWLFSTNIRFFFIKPSFPWLTVMVKKQLNILTSVAHTMTKILYIFKFTFKYKPPVVTHSPLCALDTFPNTAMCTQSHKRLSNICMFTCSCTTNHLVLFPSQLLTHNVSLCTCTVFMWSIRIVCIVCIIFIFSCIW